MSNRARLNGLLNETTGTVHKQETSKSDLASVCGVTYNLPESSLRQVEVGQLETRTHIAKCGNCFDDGRGY